MTRKPRVFLDANVLIRGVTFPRFPYEVLRHAARKEIVAVVCPLVLERARLYIRERFPDHQAAPAALLELLDLKVVADPPLEQVAAHTGLVRDPKDIPVALAAIAAGAEYLVSTDRDFTDLDDTTVELRRHLTPVSVGAFLHEVMGWSHLSLSAIERRSCRSSYVDLPRQSGLAQHTQLVSCPSESAVRSLRALLLSVFRFELDNEGALLVNLLSGFGLFGLPGGQLRLDSLHLVVSVLTFPHRALQATAEHVGRDGWNGSDEPACA